MSKRNNYQIQQKKSKEERNKHVIQGGYASSLTGISQTERAEKYTLDRRGAGVFENKKRKKTLKPKHKNSRGYSDSCVYFFCQNLRRKMSYMI